MGRREKDRKRLRRKHRKRKLRKLNRRLEEAKTEQDRQKIIQKILRITLSNQYVQQISGKKKNKK